MSQVKEGPEEVEALKVGSKEINRDPVITNASLEQRREDIKVRLQEELSTTQSQRVQKKRLVTNTIQKMAEDLKTSTTEYIALSTKIRNLKAKPIEKSAVSQNIKRTGNLQSITSSIKSIGPKSENPGPEEEVVIIQAIIVKECFHCMLLYNVSTINVLYEVFD